MKNLASEFEGRTTAFLGHTGMSPTAFGERAVGDRKFVGDVRRGRSPRLVTVERVLAFMADWERTHAPDRSPGDNHGWDSGGTWDPPSSPFAAEAIDANGEHEVGEP